MPFIAGDESPAYRPHEFCSRGMKLSPFKAGRADFVLIAGD
jgi:hypothetical protein